MGIWHSLENRRINQSDAITSQEEQRQVNLVTALGLAGMVISASIGISRGQLGELMPMDSRWLLGQ